MIASEIVSNCLRAGIFAAVVCALYILGFFLRKRRPGLKRVLSVAYIAALVQITVLRGGANWQDVLYASRDMPQLIPLKTTFDLMEGDAWTFIYNTVGNLIWFVPLGLILGRGGAMRALLLGAALSTAIELSQYLLMTGFTDVDDVILNALGSLMGWGFCRLFRRVQT